MQDDKPYVMHFCSLTIDWDQVDLSGPVPLWKPTSERLRRL